MVPLSRAATTRQGQRVCTVADELDALQFGMADNALGGALSEAARLSTATRPESLTTSISTRSSTGCFCGCLGRLHLTWIPRFTPQVALRLV